MLPFLFSLISIFLFSTASLSFEGPLRVKNQFPLFIPVSPPYLESAAAGNSFSIGLSHSSVFMIKNSAEWSVNLDMELTELNFSYKKDIPNLLELGIEVPVLISIGGFMDNFLETYHKTFGFPDYGRSARPANAFLYEVKKKGVLVVRGENGRTGLGDTRLTARKTILNTDPVLSLTAGIELPTGHAKKGFGSGSLDTAVALLIDKRLGERFQSYWNLGIVFPGDLKGYETIKLRNYIYAGAGIEAVLLEHLSLIGQVVFQGSPYPQTDIGTVDRIAALLSLGGRYTSGNNSLEFSITEDPNTAGAPDFTLNLAYRRRF